MLVLKHERAQVEEQALDLFEKLPRVCRETIAQRRESMEYANETGWREAKEAGMSGYLEGLADAGLVTYKDADILDAYFTRNW